MLGNGMYNVQRSLMANGKPRYIKFEGTFGVPRLNRRTPNDLRGREV